MEENESQCTYPSKVLRNPSPPLLTDTEKEVVTADFIGDTLFSKKWVLALLLKLYKHGNDIYSRGITKASEDPTDEVEISLDERFEKDLCDLWDSSANKEVAMFIFKHQGKEVFIDAIEKTQSPRLTEICFGIIGNLVCLDNVNECFSQDKSFRSSMLKYLDITDALSLVELTRVLRIGFSNSYTLPLWLHSFSPFTMECLLTILQNSLNITLLEHVIQLIDIIFDTDVALIDRYTNATLFAAIKDAYDVIKYEKQELATILFHILQLVSTTQIGVQKLSMDDSIFHLLTQCIFDAYNIFADSGHSLLVSIYSVLGCILSVKPFEIVTLINENVDVIKYLLNLIQERVVYLFDSTDKENLDLVFYGSVYLEFFHDLCKFTNSFKDKKFDKITACLVDNEGKIKDIFELCRREDTPLEWKGFLKELAGLNEEHRILNISL